MYFFSRHRVNITTLDHGSGYNGGVVNFRRRTRCYFSRGSGSDVGSSLFTVDLKSDLIPETANDQPNVTGTPPYPYISIILASISMLFYARIPSS